MGAYRRIGAIACSLLMVLVVLQALESRASLPNTGSPDWNYALSSHGGVATASGSASPSLPTYTIDGSMSTWWQSSSTMGWLAVAFAPRAYIDEVHLHFLSVVYPSLSLYLDTNANGLYTDPGEKVWSVTTNKKLDVIIALASPTPGVPYYASSMKVTIDGTSGKNQPIIAEFEAYLRGDTDGDGLTNSQEGSITYFQDAGVIGTSQNITENGVKMTSRGASLVQFYGNPKRALANFTVDYTSKTALTASVGYWNGSGWADRYVWDPGKRLPGIALMQPNGYDYYSGIVPVVAYVNHPEITTKVEFRIDGTAKATVTTPVGNNYRWDWNTADFQDGSRLLEALQYDSTGTTSLSRVTVKVNNLPPTVSWNFPPAGATLTGTVTLNVTARDEFGIAQVDLLLDDHVPELMANPGSNYYTWIWNTPGSCNGPHSLQVVATENTAQARSTTIVRSINTNNDPSVCISYPRDVDQVCGLVHVQATTSAGTTISKVEFYVGSSLKFTNSTGPSPYGWDWNTATYPNRRYLLSAKVYLVDGRSASSLSNNVMTLNPCPSQSSGASASTFAAADSSPPPLSTLPSTNGTWPPSQILGVLSKEWGLGETDAGSKYTLVVDLVNPQTTASASENASRILRPAFPGSLFATYFTWRLLLRDWVSSGAVTVTTFILRFEMTSDGTNSDTDGDTINDGTELNYWKILPVTKDSDLDGLPDDYEIKPHTLTVWSGGRSSALPAFTTNASKADTDGDGLVDGQERGFITTGQSKVIGEVGFLRGITGSWTTVYLKNNYTSPVVIAGPPTNNDTSAPAHARVKGITDHTFQVQIEEWPDDVGPHLPEELAYMVVEAGRHLLPDGSRVEAGIVKNVGTSYVTTTFQETFDSDPSELGPMAITQTQTENDKNSVVTKIFWVRPWDIKFRLLGNPATHAAEDVGYVVIKLPANLSQLQTWQRDMPWARGSGNWVFPSSFTAPPLMLAWFRNDWSDSDVGIRILARHNGSIDFKVEAGALGEYLYAFAFPGPMNITARLTTNPIVPDTDGDTLKDGTEVTVYGSNPTLKDSDADSIPDNVEVANRTITIPVNGTLKSFTFRTSPTSDDTDGDGVKDPDELNGILDHRLLYLDMQTTTTDGRMRDLSANGNHATLLSPPDAAGQVGRARDFRGDTYKDYAYAPMGSATIDPKGISVSLWMYLDALPSSYSSIMVSHGPYGSSWWLELYSSGSLSFWFQPSDGSLPAGVSTSVSKNAWIHAVATYDGSWMRIYKNAVSSPSTKEIRSIKPPSDNTIYISQTFGSTIGSHYVDGRIDELQVWDRVLSASEVSGYYNLTKAATSIVSWLDMETRKGGQDLLDLGGSGRVGFLSGTTNVEGKAGFGRNFAGSNDGITLNGTSGSTLFANGATLSLHAKVSSYPSSDTSLISRRGAFYLNLTSHGRIRWVVQGGQPISSPLPLALNRWVRITVTAGSAGLEIYLDGAKVASRTGSSVPPSATTLVRLGYVEGSTPHFVGSMDEVLILSTVASSWTISDLSIRGVVLNPNSTDTDYDGLPDGQELYVKSVKTPKRYPIKDGQTSAPAITDRLTLGLGAPAWAISGATAFLGVTHPDMGQVKTELKSYVGGQFNWFLPLKPYGSNAGQANNFTSYDLFGLGRERLDFARPSEEFLAQGYDNTPLKLGQLEYLQIQATAHTLPNRADTDGDGLNDSEEVNLGKDGFQTDPWKVDTDGDSLPDNEYFTARGTSPVLADTDRDGVPDNRDNWPLVDAFVEISIDGVIARGSDPHNPNGQVDPFVRARAYSSDLSKYNETYTRYLEGGGQWSTCQVWPYSGTCYTGHKLTVDVADDATSLEVEFGMWSYDTRGYNQHTRVTIVTDQFGGGCTEYSVTPIYYQLRDATSTVQLRGHCAGSTAPYADPLTITFTRVTPSRASANLVVPGDFSGIYNVTDSGGKVTSRRYVGEPRFVSLLLNVTCTCQNGFRHDLYLIPRTIFFDTLMYKKLSQQDVSGVLSRFAFRENLSSAAWNSDALQELLSGQVLEPLDTDAILGMLLGNTTGATTYKVLGLIYDPHFLYSLPDDAVRLMGYIPPPTAPSFGYTFCTISCVPPPPPSIWEQIWNGIRTVVTTLINSALVLAVTVAQRLVEFFGQLGSWFESAVSTESAAVARAVEAAGKALDQFKNWALEEAKSIIMFLIKPFLDSFDSLTKPWKLNMNNTLLSLSASENLGGFNSDRAAELAWNALLFGGLWGAFVGLALALAITTQTLAPLQFTPIGLVVSLALALVIPIILKAVLGLFVGDDRTATNAFEKPDQTWGVSVVVNPGDRWWVTQLGLAVVGFAPALIKLVRASTFSKFYVGDMPGVVIGLFGLLSIFVGGEFGKWLGLVLSVWGFTVTLPLDITDITVVSPIKYWEEVLTAAILGVTAFDVFKYYHEKY